MKTTHSVLMLALLVLSISPLGMAIVKCLPEHTCTEFISPGGTCEPNKCMADCAGKYHGTAEGQCFPQKGCMCAYCCDPRRELVPV